MVTSYQRNCNKEDSKFILDKEKAATVEVLYLVKDKRRRKDLKDAGVASTNTYIESLEASNTSPR